MRDEDKTKEQLLSELKALRLQFDGLGKQEGSLTHVAEFQSLAEQQLRVKQEEIQHPRSREDTEKLIHELQVHQKELEMQNEELRRIRRELQEARDNYFHLYDFAPIGYLTCSDKGIIQAANLTALTMLGLEPKSIIGKPFSNWILKDDRNIYYSHLKQTFETEAPQSCDLRLVKRDGLDFHTHLAIGVIKQSGGECNQIRVAMSDISELKLGERRFQDQNGFLQTLIEAIPISVFYKGVDGLYTGCNQAYADFLGLSREEIIGKAVYDVFPKDLADTYYRNDQDLFAHPGVQQYEAHMNHADGTSRDVLFNKATYKDQNGKVIGLIGAMLDITERKKAEEHLKAYQNIVASTQDGVALLDKNYRYVIINEAYERVSGICQEQLIGMSVADYLGENVFQRLVKPHFDRCLQGEIVNYQQWFDYPTMGRRFIDVTYFPYRDTRNLITGIISNTRDITERRQAEEALKESEERFRNLFENAPIGIFRTNSEGQVLSANSAMAGILGFSSRHEAPEYYSDLSNQLYVHPDRRDQFLQLLRQEGHVQNFEYKAKTFDGRHIWLSMNARVESRDNDGLLIIEGFTTDVTEHKQMQESLRQSEEKYRKLVEALPEGVFEANKGGSITFANRAALEFFEYSEDDLLTENLKIFDLIAAEDRPRVTLNIQRILNGEPIVSDEYVAVKKDGSLFPIFTSSTPFYDDDVIIGLRGIVIDLSTAKRIEREKSELEARLHQARKMEAIGTLAGGIAHEFNNILGIILGNAELAKDDIPDWNPARFNLDEIKTASLRAKDVVRQLLTFSRKAEENLQPINLVPVVKEAIKFLRSSIPTSIEIRQNIAEKCHTIIADPTQIHQVMLNLSANAAHAMEEMGGILGFFLQNVTVDATSQIADSKLTPGEYVMLEVSDTGVGIPTGFVGRIFEPYFTTKEVGKGTGMGLAVVHGIVKAHGGSIQMQSDPGRGTTFKIFFPATDEDSSPALELSEDPPTGNEYVLFIDDEQSIAKLGQLMLEKLGYQAQAETDPKRALEIFASDPERFDLIVTDMTMPGITGDQLVEEILKICPGMKIILCTGYSERVDEEHARSIGAKAYALKPLDLKQLAKVVRRVLDERT